MDLKIDDFQAVIDSHEEFDFTAWRAGFARQADALAAFFKRFPGTGRFQELAVRNAIAAAPSFRGDPMRVFAPWTDWWQGRWSNGKTYYHIWDPTVAHKKDGKTLAVQPVTQSEHGFAHSGNLATMRDQKKRVDLAINVCTAQRGITGWVSKEDGEMPHLGYLLNEVTLIWIARHNGQHFMFFEWVDPSAGTYGIHGRPFSLEGGTLERGRGRHYGTYRRAPHQR